MKRRTGALHCCRNERQETERRPTTIRASIRETAHPTDRVCWGCAVSSVERGFWWAGAAWTVAHSSDWWNVRRLADDSLDGPLVPPYGLSPVGLG